jgi:predicted kinase
MVAGIPGAGKSFFARQFADTFSVACVRSDFIRSELFGQPQYTTDENEIVNRMGEYMASELAKTGRSFLIDGNCNTKAARTQIEKLAKTNGYKTLVIWVQADPYSAKQRSLKRNPKKIDDLYNPSLTATQFEVFSQRFVVPAKSEEYVVISGMHAYSTQARTVLKKIATPHTEAVASTKNMSSSKVRQVATLSRPEPTKPSRPRGVVIR